MTTEIKEGKVGFTRKLFNGTLLDTATQCVDPETGVTGDWFFSGGSHKEIGARISPVFSGLLELFAWGRENGIEGVKGTYRHIYQEKK